MKNNSGAEIEMMLYNYGVGTNFNYIASGHERFYNELLGAAGYKLPAYPIKGTYIQLRIRISTLNPM